jgi:mitochondrial fission protein ELM1
MRYPKLTVWRFCDGKTGHEKQTQALVEGLVSGAQVECHDIPVVHTALERWTRRLLLMEGVTAQLPAPDLIIGAGHRTHWPMLTARQCRGGKVVVLMKPSLPLEWFDLAIIPEHDRPRAHPHVLTSCNVLAPGLRCHPDKKCGLIMVGGANRHFVWSSAGVAASIAGLVAQAPDIHWQLTTSRRTPADFVAPQAPNLSAHNYRDLPATWLSRELARASQVCLTMDSASMLAEALNSEAQITLLPLPARPAGGNKLQRGIEQLLARRLVQVWTPELGLHRGVAARRAGLNEHHRCADSVLQHLLEQPLATSGALLRSY